LWPEEALALQWRLASAGPPDDTFLFPGATPQRPCRDHDYRNWRKRHFRPAAIEAGAPNGRPYDLRHSFASLMLHEGRVGIVDLASQLGHSPTMTLNTCGHVIAELREAFKRSAAEQIERARRTPRGPQEPLHRPEEREPTPGLEPGTPSLRVKCSTS
jgi:integrase